MVFINKNIFKSRAGIYVITNCLNNKQYIGSTKLFNKRYWAHVGKLNCNQHPNNKLQRAWNKYGKDNFTFSVLEIVDNLTILVEREQFWLDVLSPKYNILKTARKDYYIETKKQKEENSNELKRAKCINCATSKLTEKQVIEIITLLNNKASIKEVSSKYLISGRSALDIKMGKSYKHLSHLLRDDLKRDWSPLSDKDVIKIIMYINLEVSIKEIADTYNVSLNCIRYIKKKKRWKQYSYLLK